MSQELILSTIKKVYALREKAEKRAAEKLATPLIGPAVVALGGIKLTRDQAKDVAAFVTASCNTADKLHIMDKISEFKAKAPVARSPQVLLSYVALLVPIALALAGAVALYFFVNIETLVYVPIVIVLLAAGTALGLALFGYLGYDQEYRREAFEREIWKTIHAECQKRKKLGVRTHQRLPPARLEPATPAPVITKATGAMKKL